MNPQLFKASALATIALLMPLAASASTNPDTTAPVRINDVQLSLQTIPGDGAFDMQQTTVSFTNLSPIPAKEVVFFARGDDGQIVGSYTDHGSFAQGVAIRHTFSALNPDLQRKVDVEEVFFADGTVWQAGQPNPMARRQAASVSNVPGAPLKDLVH